MRVFIIYCLISCCIVCQAQQDTLQIAVLLDGERISREELKQLFPEDLSSIDIYKDADSLIKKGYEGFDGLIEITTKACEDRPDSWRVIPRLKFLTEQEGRYYQDGVLYTGPFIDYYFSGVQKIRGKIVEGYKDGWIDFFYPNGVMEKKEYWENGKKTDAIVSWYANGKPECIFLPYSRKEDLKLICKYSDGRVKYMARPEKSGWKYEKKWAKVQKQLEVGSSYMKEGKQKLAEKAFTKAIRFNDGCAEAYYNRAQLNMDKGKVDEGLKDINRAIALDPARFEWYRDRAFYTIRKHLGNDIFTTSETEVPYIKALPSTVQKEIIRDLLESFTVLKEKDLLLSKMIWQYTDKKLDVTPTPGKTKTNS